MTAFLVRDLARSLAGAAPPALTLILYAFTFTYPADVNYFAAVAGACLLAVTYVTALLMAWRINRGSATRGSCCCVAADRCWPRWGCLR
ncbi:MAG: hypothetical protein R2873_15090 [Caldilineaceae bacterium]